VARNVQLFFVGKNPWREKPLLERKPFSENRQHQDLLWLCSSKIDISVTIVIEV